MTRIEKIDLLLLEIREANRQYDAGVINAADLKKIARQVHREFRELENESYKGNDLLKYITPLIS